MYTPEKAVTMKYKFEQFPEILTDVMAAALWGVLFQSVADREKNEAWNVTAYVWERATCIWRLVRENNGVI